MIDLIVSVVKGIAALVLGFVVYVVLVEIKLFVLPRKDNIPQKYPFEGIIMIATNLHRQLEIIGLWQDRAIAVNKKKSMVLDSALLPCLVVTNNLENVTYILKDNWKNFGKSGNVFKPRLQGLLGDGIFNADGQQWYAHRKTSAHLFKMSKFKGSILEIFNDDLDQVIDVINTSIKQYDHIIDIHDLLHRYTLESISRIAFGIPLHCIKNQHITFAKDFDYCTMSINDSFLNPLWLFERYFTPKGWKYFYALYRINSYANKIIQDRRREVKENPNIADEKNDLLTLYLDNRSFKDLLVANDEINQEHLDTFMEPSDKNLRDVILNMVIAGRDTTAQALSWCFYRMCIHPETQKKLREEALHVLTSTGELEKLKNNHAKGAIAFESTQQMKYIEAFVMEVLRFHPSVPKEAKEVHADDTLPDGTAVHKGDIVAFIPWLMGRDTELWGPDALEFRPERFLEQPKPSPFKFIAFQVRISYNDCDNYLSSSC